MSSISSAGSHMSTLWPGSARGPSAHGLDPWASTRNGTGVRGLPWMPGPRPGKTVIGCNRNGASAQLTTGTNSPVFISISAFAAGEIGFSGSADIAVRAPVLCPGSNRCRRAGRRPSPRLRRSAPRGPRDRDCARAICRRRGPGSALRGSAPSGNCECAARPRRSPAGSPEPGPASRCRPGSGRYGNAGRRPARCRARGNPRHGSARLQPSAMRAAVPIETASAPIASALATSAPLRMPPEMISCTFRC